MRVVAIIQARLGSSRLPAKLALDIAGAPLLSRVADRLRCANGLDALMLATSDRPEDDISGVLGERCGLTVFRGSLEDAQARFLGAADAAKADVVIRVTGDNPYTEPSFIEELVAAKRRDPHIPYAVHDLDKVVYGTASELIDVAALRKTIQARSSQVEREHITPTLRESTDALVLEPGPELSDAELSLTVDSLDDYVASVRLHQHFGAGRDALARIVENFRLGRLPEDATRRRARTV